jgi:D-alanyl-D-alanine carboxypeptidase
VPAKKTMRQRRPITVSVISGLIVVLLLVIGANGVFSSLAEPDPSASPSPSQVSLTPTPADQLGSEPVSIFNPPIRSIDSPDSTWLVSNKHRPLSPISYEPTTLRAPNLADPQIQNPSGQLLRDEVAWATERVATAMSNAGAGTLVLTSGYRPYDQQQAIYERTKNLQGFAVAEQLVARAGYSEHQTGLAADFSAVGQGCVILVCFGQTEAGLWLSENAHLFGFIIRYPEGKEPITGFQFEPWHLRYVGIALALEMKEKGIQTLEEFWDLPASPDYIG